MPISYLSFFDPKILPKLINAFGEINEKIVIHETTVKRITAMSNLIHTGKLSYAQALARTDLSCRAMLFLLMLLIMKNGQLIQNERSQLAILPIEVWLHVFNFVTDVKMSRAEFDSLGFFIGRNYLRTQLSVYQSGSNMNKNRAKSFSDVITSTNNKENLGIAVCNEVRILQENKPAIVPEVNKSHEDQAKQIVPDKYHKIISFWNTALTRNNVEFEPAKSDHPEKEAGDSRVHQQGAPK